MYSFNLLHKFGEKGYTQALTSNWLKTKLSRTLQFLKCLIQSKPSINQSIKHELNAKNWALTRNYYRMKCWQHCKRNSLHNYHKFPTTTQLFLKNHSFRNLFLRCIIKNNHCPMIKLFLPCNLPSLTCIFAL